MDHPYGGTAIDAERFQPTGPPPGPVGPTRPGRWPFVYACTVVKGPAPIPKASCSTFVGQSRTIDVSVHVLRETLTTCLGSPAVVGASRVRKAMPKMIRIRTDQIAAQLAMHQLHQEGVPAEVVSDSDFSIGLATLGTPLQFSLLVPSQYEERARKILAEVEHQKR